jgi:hypothetical protein
MKKNLTNSEPKSPGEIERKTYGTGGLISPTVRPIRKDKDGRFYTGPTTTNGVPNRNQFRET